MVTSDVQEAARTFSKVMRKFASKYGVRITSSWQEGYSAEALKLSYKQLLKVVHPDKGGNAQDFHELFTAESKWSASLARRKNGRPSAAEGSHEQQPAGSDEQQPHAHTAPRVHKRPAGPFIPQCNKRPATAQPSSTAILPVTMSLCEHCDSTEAPAGYRIRGEGALLTWNGSALQDPDVWDEFCDWIDANFAEWGLLYVCSTYETCRTAKKHLHTMFQFRTKKNDHPICRFAFRGIRPNVRPTWPGACKRMRDAQAMLDRGFFYVYARKIGTCEDEVGEPCVRGNYMPVWTDAKFRYEVKGDWAEALWRRYQLTHCVFHEYVVLCRDRVPSRMSNLEAVMRLEEEMDNIVQIEANKARIHSNSAIYKPFKRFAIVDEWKTSFSGDSLRYPMLIVHGVSRSGKTEFAKSLFDKPLTLKIGQLVSIFPSKMRMYHHTKYDGIVMDDIRDLEFVANHQHVFQGKPDETVSFAETPGGTRAFEKLLFKVPFVATINASTANLQYLESHDFLSKHENCVVLRLTSAPYEHDGAPAAGDAAEMAAAATAPASVSCLPLNDYEVSSVPPAYAAWTCAETVAFLRRFDLNAAAKVFHANDVNGNDFQKLTVQALQTELGMSAFLAEKVIKARRGALQ